MAIESMCANIYIVPETVPKVLAITSQVKNMLPQFRSLTEEVCIDTRRFVNEMAEIDGASVGNFSLAVSERGTAEAVGQVRNAVNRQ